MSSSSGSPTLTNGGSTFELLDLSPRSPEKATSGDVAIIGMSCRTAGGINTPEKLWDFLLQQQNASGVIPEHRWELWRRNGPHNAKILDQIIDKGYFLDHLEHFDAAFFGICPAEADQMDPQQRLGLELAWEALENAGIKPDTLRGSDTAVYMGADSSDYSLMLMGDLSSIQPWSGISTANHGIPNRISYHLGLQGPSTAVDAACASSLIAVHLARQAIVTGESTVAICGGVNIICAPGLTYTLQKAGALSPDGVCRSFDDAACGYARGEGGAVIVLKHLRTAIKDGDNILAVLKSSASAQDGRTDGIMAPSSQAQELVARQALLRGGDIDPTSIDYVEAHATSTSLGDPTEIAALARVYGEDRTPDDPCYIGSLKPNIGHLEAAAGAVGVLKAVLSLQKGIMAPQVLLTTPNTKIDWASSGLKVMTEPKAWADGKIRRAAVSNYGYGGSVCHAIFEQAPHKASDCQKVRDEGCFTPTEPVVITLSAIKEDRLPVQADAIAQWLSNNGIKDIAAVARTLSQRRAVFAYRVSFVVKDVQDAISALTEFANGKESEWTTSGRALEHAAQSGAVWVFSGHGAQWPEMGKELLRHSIFHETLSELDEVILREAGFSAVEALQAGDIGGSAKVQVLTYAVQIGLAALLKSRGVTPKAALGHSVGEIAAAVVAGCISQAEGAIIVSRRAKLYEPLEGKGAMALVNLPFEQVVKHLEGKSDIVAAVRSSPTTCVVSGTVEAVEQYSKNLEQQRHSVWTISTDVGFHSPLLRHLAEQLEEDLERVLDPQAANIALYSTSAQQPRVTTSQGSGYWRKNMVDPVLLVDAVEAASDDGFRIFMEVSTHPIVSRSISETLDARGVEDHYAFGVLKKNTSATLSVLKAMAQLHNSGDCVDFATMLGAGSWASTVPNTRWVHKPHWIPIPRASGPAIQQHNVDTHTVLGREVEIAGTAIRAWETTLDVTTRPYPLNHCLNDLEILPAAVYCTTFREATGATALIDVELRAPTLMTDDERDLQVIVEGDSVRMASRLRAREPGTECEERGTWTEHGSAKYTVANSALHQQTSSLVGLGNRISHALPENFAKVYLQRTGVSSIAFPWTVSEHFENEREMLVKVDTHPNMRRAPWDPRSWAPLLDAATSIGASIFHRKLRMRIVDGMDQVLFLSQNMPPKEGYLHIEEKSEGETSKADISILSDTGEMLLKVIGMRFIDIDVLQAQRKSIDSLVHRLAWVPPKFSETPLTMGNIFVVSETSDVVDDYISSLRGIAKHVEQVASFESLKDCSVQERLERNDSVVIYVPAAVKKMQEVAENAHAFLWHVASILSILSGVKSAPKLFVVTQAAYRGDSPSCLAQYPLYGFARVAHSEYPHIWGGLLDNEGSGVPLLAMRYVNGQSVVRIQQELPRVARLRPFIKTRQQAAQPCDLVPKPQGTYIVTGGLGAVGLEVIRFLASKGARRIVIISRTPLPSRKGWKSPPKCLARAINTILDLESLGVTVHTVPLDISSPSASAQLINALKSLHLPPVLGVVHAAGTSGYGYIRDTHESTYASVMSSKVQGALNLHNVFPCGELDFFVLFSSIGQLIGTPGQSAYAAANSFLDCLATHRRLQGCNALSIQWSAWRALGLAANTKLVDEELQSRGVGDITVQQAFGAWDFLHGTDTDHAVVARIQVLNADEPLPSELVHDVIQRRRTLPLNFSPPPPAMDMPRTKPKLGTLLKTIITNILPLGVEDIDDRRSFSDMGLDSITSVVFRSQLLKETKLQLSPIDMLEHPNVESLTQWMDDRVLRGRDRPGWDSS